MRDFAVEIVQVTHDHLSLLEDLWRADWLEEHPGDDAGALQMAAGIQKSLDHHDFLHSDSFWLLAAQVEGKFVGYATVVRIPKVDDRLLFLFVDELFVLKAFRRRGVATALLKRAFELGCALSVAGVRLIVESANENARQLYRACGFSEEEAIFCERYRR